MANAVDASGKVAVGELDFLRADLARCEGICPTFDSRAVIWDGPGFGGRFLQNVLSDAGVDTGAFILTNATAVRIVPSGRGVRHHRRRQRLRSDRRADPRFQSGLLVRLAGLGSSHDPASRPAGLQHVADVLNQVNANPQGLGDVAEHKLCMRPQGAGANDPWCFFSYGTGTWFQDPGTDFAGTMGLGHYFNPSTRWRSTSGSIGSISTRTTARTRSTRPATTSAATSRTCPIPGGRPTGRGGFVVARPHIVRRYANGMGTATSRGSTDGSGWGVAGWLGYAIQAAKNNIVTPFAQLDYVATHYDGWTETGGPFPAMFQPVDGPPHRSGWA